MTRFKECRINSGLSQKCVAERLGIKPPSISGWESGKTSPSMENLVALAAIYDVTTDYLLGCEDGSAESVTPAETFVAERIKEIRLSHGYTQKEIADYLKCSCAAYCRYEKGLREPSIEVLLCLAKLYGVSVDELLGNTDIKRKFAFSDGFKTEML